MNIEQFNDLDELEQYEALWEHGVMIGDTTDGVHKIILYQMFSFYIEVYHHMEYNVLRKLISFSDTELLDGYLNQFKLPDLS